MTDIATKPSIYEQIIANIKADPKSWCQTEYVMKDGDTISACLVGHVELATGTVYQKGKKLVISKSPAKWRRRNEIVARLATLIRGEEVEPDPIDRGALKEIAPNAPQASRADLLERADAEYAVTSWNDAFEHVCLPGDRCEDVPKRSRKDVLALLRKAARRYPND